MKLFSISILLFISTLTYAQETTTFILVRHAEKVVDGTKDPLLTKEGEARAIHLAEIFAKADISAIYSTDLKRTRMTVAPLAKAKELEIQTYEWKSPKALLNKILEANTGGTVVISGHSNTTPILANFLLGSTKFEQFDDSDYGNLLIITTSKIGAGKQIHLRY